METNPDLLDPHLIFSISFPLCIPSPPKHTLKKEEVYFLSNIKERNKNAMIYK